MAGKRTACSSTPPSENFRRCSLIMTKKAGPLQCPQGQEHGIQEDITEPQARWFHEQAEQPFETGPLHPSRCLFDAAGVKVKSGAHAEHDASGQLLDVFS